MRVDIFMDRNEGLYLEYVVHIWEHTVLFLVHGVPT